MADAYSAMTSDRPYHKGLSQSAALAELQSCAGAQFDPALVDLFVEMLARGESGDAASTLAG